MDRTEQHATALEMLSCGGSIESISRETHLNRETIHRIRDGRRFYGRLTNNILRQVKSLFEEGRSQRSIAMLLKISRGSVQAILEGRRQEWDESESKEVNLFFECPCGHGFYDCGYCPICSANDYRENHEVDFVLDFHTTRRITIKTGPGNIWRTMEVPICP